MNTNESALYPPNSRWMSDLVITDVRQRAEQSSSDVLVAEPTTTIDSTTIPESGPLQSSFPVRHQTLTVRFVQTQKRPPTIPSVTRANRTASAAHDTAMVIAQQSTQSQAETEREFRRQRNRVHQAKHKAKQKKRLLDLEEGVVMLREEIQRLMEKRQKVYLSVPEDTTVWSVMAEYCRLFRYGSRPYILSSEVNGMVTTRCQVDASVQRQFVQATMAPNMTFNTAQGVEAMLESWRLVTLCHDDMDNRLLGLENGPGGSFVISTKGSFTITVDALRLAYPHLLIDGEPSPLALRLLGKEIVATGTIQVTWDEDTNRIVDFQGKADMVTPMLKLLGNLEDVSRVFDRALLTPEYVPQED